MRTSLSIKTLFRTMAKTVFTFILIAAITFTLFSQVAEYLATKQEFEANINSYNGTGTVEATMPLYRYISFPYYIKTDPRVDFAQEEYRALTYAKITGEQLEKIKSLPYITQTHTRYMTAGIVDSMYREGDWDDSYDYAARLVIEGTLTSVEEPKETIHIIRPNIHLTDCKILAGQDNIEMLRERYSESDIAISYDNMEYYEFSSGVPMGGDFERGVTINYWERNHGYEVNPRGSKCVSSVKSPDYIYTKEYFDSLEIGGRYVFVVRYCRAPDHFESIKRYSMSIFDFLAEPWCKAVWDVNDAPENYLELPEYAPLKTCVDITNSDVHTFDMVYADDMSVIKRVTDGYMQLSEGRWLTPEDTENDAKVCVINKTIADKYGLKLGDKLPVKLGHELFEQFYGLGAVAVTPGRFSEEWTEDEFEIAGIYEDPVYTQKEDPNWSYSVSTIFVPLSSLPVTESELEGHMYAPSEFSFEVGNAWDIVPFTNECVPQIKALGLRTTFEDGGWTEISTNYERSQPLARIRIALLAGVTLLATGFVVYLFITRKKKDYAIMRALGTTKKRSAKSLLTPLMTLSASAVVVGVAAGMIYIVLSHHSVPIFAVAVCLLGELAITLIFAEIMLTRLSCKSPLELLQDRQSKKAKNLAAVGVSAPAVSSVPVIPRPAEKKTVKPAAVPQEIVPAEKPKNRHHIRFVLRYIFRHIRRQKLKSTLAILLAALMVGAITQFASMKEVYNQLRAEMPVTAIFRSALFMGRVISLEEDGLAADMYYEAKISHDLQLDGWNVFRTNTDIVVTNDLFRYVGGDSPEIEYAPGYDDSCMEQLGDVAIVGDKLMEDCGFSLGDTIMVTKTGRMEYLRDTILRIMENEHPDVMPTDEAIQELYLELWDASVEEMADKFTIVGKYHSDSGVYGETIFTPGKNDILSAVGTTTTMDYAEFRLADNSRADEMRALGIEYSAVINGSFEMDTSKLESVIRTSDLLNGLYPIAVAVALVIGAAMCALIVMQTSKDAAIMRAQGTTKRKTRAMLAVEQILLGAVGIAVGMCVMLAIKRNAFADIALQAGIFAAAYAVMVVAGSVVSAVFATKKNILELLQTKE